MIQFNFFNCKYIAPIMLTAILFMSACAYDFPYDSFKKSEEVYYLTPTGKAIVCNAPTGWRDIVNAADNKIIGFGEAHGRNESPYWFSQFVCALGSINPRVIVLLEIPDQFDDALNAGLSKNDPVVFWQKEMRSFWCFDRDRRPSEAWLKMLLHFSELKKAGLDISVRSIAKSSVKPPKTSRMLFEARRIEALSKDFSQTVVLSGNIHPPSHKRILGDEKMFIVLQTVFNQDSKSCWHNQDCYSLSKEVIMALQSKPRKMMGLIDASVSSVFGKKYDAYMHYGLDTFSPKAREKYFRCPLI